MEDTARDFDPIYARLAGGDSLPAGAVLDGDRVFTRGSGEGWATDGDI
jgi:phenylalanine-4-hydroxylase